MSTERRPYPQPDTLHLGDLIRALEAADQKALLPIGFHRPHSYRGYYEQLAFVVATDVYVSEMLSAARSALNKTYQGWKGGDYFMDEYVECWLVQDQGYTGESLGAVLLDLMLRSGKGSSPKPDGGDSA